MRNSRVEAVKQAIRQPFTFPGCYPKTFVSLDGLLCHKCVKDNFRAVINDTQANRGAWNLVEGVLWEGVGHCVDCGTDIESAYGPNKGQQDPE